MITLQTINNGDTGNAAAAKIKGNDDAILGAMNTSLLSGVMANISTFNFLTLNAPSAGYIEFEANSAGGRARANVINGITLGQSFTVDYFYLPDPVAAGLAPRWQLTNSTGGAVSNFPTLKAGINREIITATTAGNWALGMVSTAAGKGKIWAVMYAGANVQPLQYGDTTHGLLLSMVTATAMKNAADITALAATIPAATTYTYDPTMAAGKNLFNPANAIEGSYVDTTGNIIVNAGYVRTPPIPITGGQPLSFVRNSSNAQPGTFGCLFDAGMVFVAYLLVAGTTYSGALGVAPANARFFIGNVSNAVSRWVADKAGYMIEQAATPSAYEPWKGVIEKINGSPLKAVNTGGGGGGTTYTALQRAGVAFMANMDDDAVFRFVPSSVANLTLTGTPLPSMNSAAVLTMTNAASAEIPSSALAHRQDYIIEGHVKSAATNKFAVEVRTGSTVQAKYVFDPVAGTVTETIDSGIAVVYTLGNNFDMVNYEAHFYVNLDILNKTVFLLVQYYNAGGADNIEKQQKYYTPTRTYTGSTTNRVKFSTDAAGVGVVTLREGQIYSQGLATDGSSITAGSAANDAIAFSPYDGFKSGNVPEQYFGFWLNKMSGGKRIAMNLGVASGQSETMRATCNDLIRMRPKYVVTDFSVTNDISHSPSIPDATTKANIIEMLEKFKTAGIRVVIMECLPRDVFGSTGDARAKATNTWFATLPATYDVRVARVYKRFQNPANALQINPLYCNDGSHPNTYGHHLIYAPAVYEALTQFEN